MQGDGIKALEDSSFDFFGFRTHGASGGGLVNGYGYGGSKGGQPSADAIYDVRGQCVFCQQQKFSTRSLFSVREIFFGSFHLFRDSSSRFL